MISESFFSHVSNNAGVKALCKSVFTQKIPQNEPLPAITFRLAGGENFPLLDGGSSALKVALFDVDCWSQKLIEAHAVASAVKTSLVGHTGTFGTFTADHIRLERLPFELFEDQTELHRVSMQFFIAYT